MTRAPLRVGLIGAGRISELHLPTYLESGEVELTAVCDIDEDAAQRVAAAAGIEDVYVDADKMILHADIDAVDICSTHDQHRPQVEAAAAAGKHVLVEKAMGRSLDECRAMVAATEKAGVTFMVAQNLRYSRFAPAVKRLLDDGVIGRVDAVRCDGAMDTKAFLRPGDWMLDRDRAGGGTVITFSTHIIDLLRYFVGDVRRVSAVQSTVWAEFTNGAEDYACATLEFENGAIGSLFSTMTGSRAPMGVSYTLYGELGVVCTVPPLLEPTVEQLGRPLVAAPATDGTAAVDPATVGGFVAVEPAATPSTSSFVNEILHFAECCHTGREPLSSGRDNLGTMKAVFGIYEAARSGRTVELASL